MAKLQKTAAIFCIGILLSLLSGCGNSEAVYVTAPQSPEEAQSSYIPNYAMESVGETGADPESAIPPKPWVLDDWVSVLYQEDFLWTDDVGNTNRVSITLPCFNPVYDCAAAYNEEIQTLGQRLTAEIRESQDNAVSSSILSVSFEAYLNEDILSIVLIEQYQNDYVDYTVHSFSLTEARQLSLTDYCEAYLDLDYPAFIMASNTLIEKEFAEKYEAYGTENEPEFYAQLLSSIAADTVSIAKRELFLGENGQLMLLYEAPSMAGAGSYPTIAAFDIRKIGWTCEPEEEAYYDYLFSLALQSGSADTTACEDILKSAFEDDADDFSEELSKRSQQEIDTIASILALGYGIQKDQLTKYAGYLDEENVKNALLTAVDHLP